MTLADDQPDAAEAQRALSDADKAKLYVDVWKQTVEVQKLFNDLEWRIRGLALTAATFALGASAIAAREGTTVGGISLGAVVLLAGVLLWHAFYFADRYWYHPLLIASVRHGEQLETELRQVLPQVGLTLDITEGSPSKPPLLWFWRRSELHSSDKLRYFYVVGGMVLVLAAVLLQAASCLGPGSPSTSTSPGMLPAQETTVRTSRSSQPPTSLNTPPSRQTPAVPPPTGTPTSPGANDNGVVPEVMDTAGPAEPSDGHAS